MLASWWDDLHGGLWRTAERADLLAVQRTARQVAREVAAPLRESRAGCGWSADQARLLAALDANGLTGILSAAPNDPAMHLALALWELASVDGGAATLNMSGFLAQMPIRDFGTAEQKDRYLGQDGLRHGALCLTEPIPGAGAEAVFLGGSVRVADQGANGEPLLEVRKRGRFTSHMEFAEFVAVAVSGDGASLRGSCLVILEPGDEGLFERGLPVRKLGHRLASTTNPVFDLRVPASRVIGGYTIQDGALLPRFDHRQLLDPVLRRTRALLSLMTASKALSTVEAFLTEPTHSGEDFLNLLANLGEDFLNLPTNLGEDFLNLLINLGAPGPDFRTWEFMNSNHPGPKNDNSSDLQLWLRLAELWAAGEAASSLGFSAVRGCDEFDRSGEQSRSAPNQRWRPTGDETCVGEDAHTTAGLETGATGCVFVAALLPAAAKLFSSSRLPTLLRQVAACAQPGSPAVFALRGKVVDAQIESMYIGPEALQRRQISAAMLHPGFLGELRAGAAELEAQAANVPSIGSLSAGTRLWLWTLEQLQQQRDARGARLYSDARQGVSFAMADALCDLLAARALIVDVLARKEAGSAADARILGDLCTLAAGRAAARVAQSCAGVLFGYAGRFPISTEASCAFDEMQAKLFRSLRGTEDARLRLALFLRAAHQFKAA